MIALAESDEDIAACYSVMAELRPHLLEEKFVALCRHLADTTGFRIAYVTEGDVKAVAGFRVAEWLGGGKYLEIEDLVTKSGDRSTGYGGQLFEWLVLHAKQLDCDHLRLVSNVTRADAHKFYVRHGMTLQAYYFSLNLRMAEGQA